jgi:hypothetical protein
MQASSAIVLCSFFALLLVPLAQGHFRLMEPKSWVVENDLGNPQKPAPCGGVEGAAGITPSNAITKVQGGQKLHIKLMETVFHPGHYRIALAVNSRSELPPDPEVVTRETEKGPWSVSARIEADPKPPLLVDGLWPHTTRATVPFETDLQLPNINCPACTLQIVEFMAEHGHNKEGDYSYHHCAVLNINADPAKPLDTQWPTAK